jgi:hypothetical protein
VNTPTVGARIAPELLDSVRRITGLPDSASAAQIVRAGLLKLAGHPDPESAAVVRRGPKAKPRT